MREITKYHDTSKTVKERAKNKLFGAVYSHTAIILLLILLQIGIMILTFTYLGNYSTYMNGVMSLLSFITAIYIFNEKGNPAFKMTWILFVFLVPVVGVGFYLFTKAGIGTKYLGARLEKLRVETEPYMQQNEYVVHAMKGGRVANANLSHFLYNQVGFPTYGNSQAQYFPLGDDKFPVLIEELNKAEKFIFMEYFIIGEGYVWDTVLEVLRKKVKEGVEVRLMYDGTCSISLLPYEYPKQLREYGIQCKEFGPIVPILSTSQNNRDHRKIFVVDGAVGFTGGINLADEYINEVKRFGYWKDTGVRIEGEAVWSLTSMFLSMWNYIVHSTEDYSRFMPAQHQKAPFENDGFVQPYGDSPLDHENVGENIYLNIINRAKNYVYIFTPYLIIDHEMLTALCNAAKDGVDVRIVTPGIPDKKMIFLLTQSYYAPLIQSGVKIYQYTPGFIHAKCFVCDDEIATVGSVNLDFRSLYLHFECGVFFYRSAVVAQVKEDCLNTFACSEQMTAEFCRNRPVPVRLLQSVLRLLAPLL